MDKSENKDQFLQQIVAVIDEAFVTVDSLREVDELITTEELLQAVNSFYLSKDFDPGELVVLLTEFGFKFTATHSGALQFVWLVKRR